jgi:hypothetical protein
MDDAPANLTKGTRPYEAMVPCKPWTSQFNVLDDVTARQSRVGQGSARYRDGTLRKDRPRPPPSPRANLVYPTGELLYKRPNNPLTWNEAGAPSLAETTTKQAFAQRPDINSGLTVSTRCGLSPRYMKSVVGEVVFSDTMNYLPPRIPVVPADDAVADAPAPIGTMVDALELQVRHEQRRAELARSRLLTAMRGRLVDNPIGLHDPAGAP